jgi:two-component system CheB/CheR fusion protein
MNVLIVEDNPDVAEMLAILVHALGHTTQVCYDAHEAIATARRWTPQAVITDIGLPGMDGYQLAPILHEECGLAEVPIYSLSAYPDNAARRQQAGIAAHYCKPITLPKLREILPA